MARPEGTDMRPKALPQMRPKALPAPLRPAGGHGQPSARHRPRAWLKSRRDRWTLRLGPRHEQTTGQEPEWS